MLVVEIPVPTFDIIENELTVSGAAYLNVPGAPKLRCFSLYPNPTTGRVTVHLQSPTIRPVDIAVYDATGRFIDTIYSGIIVHGTEEFTCRLPTGVYFVTLRDTNTTYIKKLVVIK